MIQCGGLWFVNGKISITWNLKQAIVQKPKQAMEGTCFLRPKATDMAKIKAMPPPEDPVDPDGVPTTIVADSDDEHEEEIAVPQLASVAVAAQVVVEEEVAAVEEVKPKKKITRKKADA